MHVNLFEVFAEKEIKAREIQEWYVDNSDHILILDAVKRRLKDHYAKEYKLFYEGKFKTYFDSSEEFEKTNKTREEIRVSTSISAAECNLEAFFDPQDSATYTNANTREGYAETVIIAELYRGEFSWRAIQTVTVRSIDVENVVYEENQQSVIFTQFIEFSVYSYSHFQNCPIPPDPCANSSSSTQKNTINLLMGGCPSSINRFELTLATKKGGSKWIKLTKYLRSVTKHYTKCPKNLTLDYQKSLIGYLSKSETIQKLLKKQFPRYSTFMQKLSKEIIGEPSNREFNYSFFLDSVDKRRQNESRCIVIGES